MLGQELESINILKETGLFRPIDLQLAGLLLDLTGKDDLHLALAAVMVNKALEQGHVCLDLSRIAGQSLYMLGEFFPDFELRVPAFAGPTDGLRVPELNTWLEKLKDWEVVGESGQFKPLILNDTLLYWQRYFSYEQELFSALELRGQGKSPHIDLNRLKQSLDRYFPPSSGIDWQRLACFISVYKSLCVITGGPGTGKTTTVVKILAVLAEQYGPGLKVAVCAPTGKAAQRLSQALSELKQNLGLDQTLKHVLPDEALTIHRLLGYKRFSPYFRHNRDNPLPVDVLVVDEVSMVDLPLMTKLVQALRDESRLILLGDKDQLSPVGAGAVMGDICALGEINSFSNEFRDDYKRIDHVCLEPNGHDRSFLGDCLVELRQNFRFGDESHIARISRAIRSGQTSVLYFQDSAQWQWIEVEDEQKMNQVLPKILEKCFHSFCQSSGPEEGFAHFNRARILCPLKNGIWGVEGLNFLAEKVFEAKGWLKPMSRWYDRRPVMITQNDYGLRLFNGDIGLTWKIGDQTKVYFQDESGAHLRAISPVRIVGAQTAFAMTVHKSQGSEFDTVILVLPPKDIPLLTRELVYTAVTRAKKKIVVLGRKEIWLKAISKT